MGMLVLCCISQIYIINLIQCTPTYFNFVQRLIKIDAHQFHVQHIEIEIWRHQKVSRSIERREDIEVYSQISESKKLAN